MADQKAEVTTSTLAEAFTEWERRWREEPEKFQSETMRLLKGVTPETYGEACAPYLLSILEEQGSSVSLAEGDPAP